MNKRDVLIIIVACLITAILVGTEVYFWVGNKNVIQNTQVQNNPNNPITGTPVKVSPNEIKTESEGIAACEQNRSYANAKGNTEEGNTAKAMTDYCYAVIAGKFNDLNLCKRAFDKSGCEKTATDLINMGKEIQNLSPEERAQFQNLMNNR